MNLEISLHIYVDEKMLELDLTTWFMLSCLKL